MDDVLNISTLPRDLRSAAATLGRGEARFLVDTYYTMQRNRMASNNQKRDLAKGEEPHATIGFFADQFQTLEKQVAGALKVYAEGDPLGVWCLANYGIGPVITAGLLAHIDIEKAPTVGHIWRFAGLDPTVTWGKGEKRPFNADLKVLCWKIGESFKKFHNREDCFYGGVYAKRKAYEVERNEAVKEFSASLFADDQVFFTRDGVTTTAIKIDGEVVTVYAVPQTKTITETSERKWFYGGNVRCAAETLVRKKIQDADTLERYRSGKLPDGRLDARSTRYAAKLFLSHYHDKAYRLHHGTEPPLPYPIAHLGHNDYIAPHVPTHDAQAA